MTVEYGECAGCGGTTTSFNAISTLMVANDALPSGLINTISHNSKPSHILHNSIGE